MILEELVTELFKEVERQDRPWETESISVKRAARASPPSNLPPECYTIPVCGYLGGLSRARQGEGSEWGGEVMVVGGKAEVGRERCAAGRSRDLSSDHYIPPQATSALLPSNTCHA